MQTRLTLTLLLILLAAIIAAAAIFFLLARPVPPGTTGAASPAPPSAQPAAGPSLTIVAESILDQGTGQALQADVYLNGALLYEQVTHFQVTIPLDGSAEIRVAAPGYKPWGIRPRGGGSDKVMRGPVRLQPE
jgi:hypothetical protein